MGGDGGVIAVNREFMRGTSTSAGAKSGMGSAASQTRPASEVRKERLTTCAVSGRNLTEGEVVVCDLGGIYLKEEILSWLLRRAEGKRSGKGEESTDLQWIRGLKDLYPLQLPLVCTVTGSDLLNTSVSYCIVVKGGGGDVVSEKAVKQMGLDGVVPEGGRLVKLGPTEEEKREIWEEVEGRRREEKEEKKRRKEGKGEGKKRKKEKEGGGGKGEKKKKKNATAAVVSAGSAGAIGAGARSLTSLASSSRKETSAAVSSMFHDSNKDKGGNGNDLFACTGGRRY